jgi:hypothetical protein
MPKPPQTPEQRALRLRGYELYLTVDSEGRRRSLRSIAMELGVTLATVQYWRKRDRWDERVQQALRAQAASAQAGAKAIGALLRTTLHEHVETLASLARDPTLKPADRIRAVRELAEIAIKLKAIDPADLAEANRPAAALSFKDDLDGPDVASAEDPVRDAPAAATAGPDQGDQDGDAARDDDHDDDGPREPDPGGPGDWRGRPEPWVAIIGDDPH